MEVVDASKDQGLNVTHCSGRVRGFSARARAIRFHVRRYWETLLWTKLVDCRRSGNYPETLALYRMRPVWSGR